jgi:serine phosphatase RsbU (regulator of sigma subunit)
MMTLTGPMPGLSQIERPRSSAASAMQSLRAELDRELLEHGKLQQAIFEAAQVQRRLCAPRELAWSQFEIAGEIFPVRHLSGDFFKVMELDGVLAIAVGDIAGKGLSAGIWLTHLLSLVQRCARTFVNPSRTVAEINRELCRELGEPPLTALFYAILDPRTNEITYCNAGLPTPLLLGAEKSMERLDVGGPMLGAVDNAVFDSGYLRLNPGDMLVAYSDGVTECRNPQDEEFEMNRLAATARAVHGTGATPALFSMLGTVLDFADSNAPGDDLTLLVVHRRPEDASASADGKDCSMPQPQRKVISVTRAKRAGQRGRGSK